MLVVERKRAKKEARRVEKVMAITHYDVVRLYGWTVIVSPSDDVIIVENYSGCRAITASSKELLLAFFKAMYPESMERYGEALKKRLDGIVGYPVIATCEAEMHTELLLTSGAARIASLSYEPTTSSGGRGTVTPEEIDESRNISIYDARSLPVNLNLGLSVHYEAYYLEGETCIQVTAKNGVRNTSCPYEVYIAERVFKEVN